MTDFSPPTNAGTPDDASRVISPHANLLTAAEDCCNALLLVHHAYTALERFNFLDMHMVALPLYSRTRPIRNVAPEGALVLRRAAA